MQRFSIYNYLWHDLLFYSKEEKLWKIDLKINKSKEKMNPVIRGDIDKTNII